MYLYIYRERRQWQPTPVLLPGKSHGQRSLVGCSPSRRVEHDWATSLSLFTWREREIININNFSCFFLLCKICLLENFKSPMGLIHPWDSSTLESSFHHVWIGPDTSHPCYTWMAPGCLSAKSWPGCSGYSPSIVFGYLNVFPAGDSRPWEGSKEIIIISI